MRILLAEDIEATRVAMKLVLESAGHDVVAASDGIEALRHSEKGRFDVAVLDIWMPRQSGLDVLRTLRERGSDLPVVLVSGGGPGASLQHAATLGDIHGAAAILFKPVADRELLAAVVNALEAA